MEEMQPLFFLAGGSQWSQLFRLYKNLKNFLKAGDLGCN